MKRFLAFALLTCTAAAAYAQKGPLDELGFHAEKLYDFSGVDSVNLFNGNLVVSIPVGPRYSVSSNLSYQFTLVFNGKVNDTETWCEDPFNTGCTGTNIKQRNYPNLGSNAGNGWRLSLGRLLPPTYTGRYNDSLDDSAWLYEGPAGDEHAVTGPNAHDGMRMQVLSSIVREIEFGSGEIHRFELENAVWRLKQMRDRFNNAVTISYSYSADGRQEQSWTVTDTVSRSHTVLLQNFPSMADGWSRGQMVSQLTLQGYNGAPAIYSLAYSTAPTGYPNLSSLTQPDATQYTFSGNLSKIRYPTGGTVVYDYDYFTFAPQDSYCSIPVAYAVVKRTVSDGATTRIWDYVQQVGRFVPVTTQLYPPCTDDGSIYGPIYWARTSVLAPLDAASQRGRIDHYFSVFADNLGGSTSGFTVNNPLSGQGTQKYGHPGAIGVPPLDARRHRTVPFYNADIDARDTTDSAARLLATETYANCDINGDCTAMNLLRSTYERYTGDVFPRTQGEHGLDDTRLVSSRTVFNDDSSCGTQQSPQLCYTQVTNSDDNGAMLFRTSELTSNFPGAQTVSTTTQFPQWTVSDLTNHAWFLSTFTDKTKSENGVTARE